MGTALAEVSKKSLYRDKYNSIEDYCRQELGYSRAYAYNLMGSAEVHAQLSSIEDIKLPVNEAQCRELIQVPQEKRVQAWKNAVEVAGKEPLTAKIIHAAVAKFKPKSARKTKVKAKKGSDIETVWKLIDAIEKLAGGSDAKKLAAKFAELRAWIVANC